MHITILICTHNRLNLLRTTILSLNNAIRPENTTIDLLVVANACTDDTLNWLKQYPKSNQQLEIRFLEEPMPGKSYALNMALGYLDCDLVVLIDDDHRVDNHFLENIVLTAINNPSVSIFCGRILPDWDGSEPDWVHEQGTYRIYPPPIPIYDQGLTKRLVTLNMDQPGGGNLFIRLDALKQNGKFSTKLGPKGHNFIGGEDSEFLKRAVNQGEDVLYNPEIIQFHFVDQDRLKLRNLLQLAYQRSRCITMMERNSTSNDGVPLYMWRKFFTYCFNAMTTFKKNEVRCYMVRIAATLGEIKGLQKSI